MSRLRFGTAGIPACSKGTTTVEGIRALAKLGLDAMELEFVQSVHMSEQGALEASRVAQEHDIALTVHAPYYLNLNARDQKTLAASRKRILDSARIGRLAGAWSVAFHAAFYLGEEKREVFKKVKQQLGELRTQLDDEGNGIFLSPELTGKETQFGDLEELLKLSEEIPGVSPCVDFAHYHARKGGGQNSYEEFSQVLETIQARLGKKALETMHIHVAGIEYGAKGERKHLNLMESDLKYKDLLKALKDKGAGGSVICESPNLEGDALLLKRGYARLG
jgi:deoxyribonuclease-4